MKPRLLPAFLALALVPPAFAAPVEYTIDPSHSQVEITWNHLGFSNITARFDALEGRVVYDAENPSASSVSATVRIDSIDSGVDKLDQHLQADDFFDAAKFPTAQFTSTAVAVAGEGRLKLDGDLTIHGQTRPVSFEVTINKIGEHPMRKVPAAGFDATATIRRTEFGVGNYAPAVSDEIRIEITIEATAKPAA